MKKYSIVGNNDVFSVAAAAATAAVITVAARLLPAHVKSAPSDA